jgi:dual specificity tyrosine-phosphorylation-regulated kinase 2/3/4
MKQKGKVGIKLIDFGTSMFSHETNFSYIQSRFYRAPEVILGAKYSVPIDMWSFGCLVA